MKKENNKNFKEPQSIQIKKFIRKFNRNYNLESLFISPNLLKKLRKMENLLKIISYYFLIPIAVLLFIAGYYFAAENFFYFYPSLLALIPTILFLMYYYFIFLHQTKKDIKSDNKKLFSYWATDEHKKKRFKMIAKDYSQKQRKELCRLARLEYEMEVANRVSVLIVIEILFINQIHIDIKFFFDSIDF